MTTATVRQGRSPATAPAMVLLLAGFVFLLLAVIAKWHPLISFDTRSDAQLHQLLLGHTTDVKIAKDVSYIGMPEAWYPIIVVIAVILLLQRELALAVFVGSVAVGGAILNEGFKIGLDRHRPVLTHPFAHSSSGSFPSGHSMGTFFAAAVLLFLFLRVRRGAGARLLAALVAIAFVVVIAFTRLALGLHYPSDLLAGWALAGAWFTFCLLVLGSSRTARGGGRHRVGLSPSQLRARSSSV